MPSMHTGTSATDLRFRHRILLEEMECSGDNSSGRLVSDSQLWERAC